MNFPTLSLILPLVDRVDEGPIAKLRQALKAIDPDGELLVTGPSGGFGGAVRAGLESARGQWVMTVDPGAAQSPDVVGDLWRHRGDGEIIVASRYVSGAHAKMRLRRRIVSRTINQVFSRGLSVPVTDLSSVFRLYRGDVLRSQTLAASDYDVLPELLVRALAGGWRVAEIPLRAEVSRRGASGLARLSREYVRTFASLWQLRNSIAAGDYDARAYDSIIPLQRYWQRQRYKHVTELISHEGAVCDVGCGSSRIIGALPKGSVAIDILPQKLRYARRYGVPLVRASGFALPFADASFPCVLCSQVIEHVPMDSPILCELRRVLQPGGRLVLGTPDYDRWEWVYMEKAYGFFKPGGYADEHIAHYSYASLVRQFASLGYVHEETRYILRGELVLAFRKPGSARRRNE
jgi:ubiquinone/menaquinone biosynthesis C-methylase UbiE